PCHVQVVPFVFQPVFTLLFQAPPGTVTSISDANDASRTSTRTPLASGSGAPPDSGERIPLHTSPSSPGGVWSFVRTSLPSVIAAAQPASSHASPIPSPSVSRCAGSDTVGQSSAASG